MRADDAEAYRSEVLGELRWGVAAFFEPEPLQACVVPGRRELPPAKGVRYRAVVDPSGGVAKGAERGDLVSTDPVNAVSAEDLARPVHNRLGPEVASVRTDLPRIAATVADEFGATALLCPSCRLCERIGPTHSRVIRSHYVKAFPLESL